MTEDLRGRKWWRGIAPGDTVFYVGGDGVQQRGRVVMSLPSHVVLNTGGRHGTAQVVNEANYTAHKPAKK